jgi:hypothetical protein
MQTENLIYLDITIYKRTYATLNQNRSHRRGEREG